jgi:hypothetical protein
VAGRRALSVVPPRHTRHPGNKVGEFGLVTGTPQVPAPAQEGGTSPAGVLLKASSYAGTATAGPSGSLTHQ